MQNRKPTAPLSEVRAKLISQGIIRPSAVATETVKCASCSVSFERVVGHDHDTWCGQRGCGKASK